MKYVEPPLKRNKPSYTLGKIFRVFPWFSHFLSLSIDNIARNHLKRASHIIFNCCNLLYSNWNSIGLRFSIRRMHKEWKKQPYRNVSMAILLLSITHSYNIRVEWRKIYTAQVVSAMRGSECWSDLSNSSEHFSPFRHFFLQRLCTSFHRI